MNTELTEKNTLNWLQFLIKILPDQEDKKRIRTFVRQHTHTSHDYTSYRIYMKYCK